jgi:hypothetical protein
MDDNDCKLEDLCIPVPKDANTGDDCLSFECPPICDESVQKYCKGNDISIDGQVCPARDYCVDRPLDNNSIRCPGHCTPQCDFDFVARAQIGTDQRGCPLADVCEAI